MIDPYQILGVTKETSPEDIKKAYKNLALKWHPDRNNGDPKAEEKFKEINNAYQIVTGKTKQDQFGGFADEEIFEFFRNGGGFPFGDVFTPFQTKAQVRLSMQISLEEACEGGKKTVRFSKRDKCSNCAGLGREIIEGVCPNCNGTGRFTTQTSSIFSIMMTCQMCSGLGKKFGNSCNVCRGVCTITTNHETTVDIPPGIGNGEAVIALDGSCVIIHYMKHPIFEVISGTLNVESEIETSLFDFMLGGEATVPTLIGEKRVKIDPGLRPGSRLRIRDAGMKDRQGKRGDHVVRIWAKMPKLTEDHQQIIEKIKTEIEAQ